ncbi:hypothetical protein B0H14DRAFT_2693150 [Mycena olivaceomarginata]|nr:hypothetical protein B0H14DRAFT_2693150 [Mycena olivaceomarginata]
MQYIVDSEPFDSSWNTLIRNILATGISLLLYGICINLFILSIYTLARRREAAGIKVLIAASCVMAVAGTAQTIVTVVETAVTTRLVQQLVHEQVLNRPHYVKSLLTSENVLLAINLVITDSFFMYRCYLIWGCRRNILILPVLLMLATLLAGILGSPTSSITNAQLGPLGLAAATNLVLTSLTVGRILWVRRRQSSHVGLGHTFRSRYTSVI